MGAISRFIAKNYLRKRNAIHLARHPQLACFAYDLISTAIFVDGQFEASELDFLREKVFPQLDRTGICLDIGANIGNHSLDFARSFAKVYAFEPNPSTFQLLRYNAGLVAGVEALNFGLSSAPRWVSAHQVAGNIGASHITGSGADSVAGEMTFEVRRLDDLDEVRAADRIAFMKVDVEGHELQCLVGAEATLKKHRPVVVLEVLAAEIENGKSPAVEFLRSIGYDHIYDLTTPGTEARLGRVLNKLGRLLTGALLNRPAGKRLELVPVRSLSSRNHPMVICSTRPIGDGPMPRRRWS